MTMAHAITNICQGPALRVEHLLTSHAAHAMRFPGRFAAVLVAGFLFKGRPKKNGQNESRLAPTFVHEKVGARLPNLTHKTAKSGRDHAPDYLDFVVSLGRRPLNGQIDLGRGLTRFVGTGLRSSRKFSAKALLWKTGPERAAFPAPAQKHAHSPTVMPCCWVRAGP
jgi:hypothetical protein